MRYHRSLSQHLLQRFGRRKPFQSNRYSPHRLRHPCEKRTIVMAIERRGVQRTTCPSDCNATHITDLRITFSEACLALRKSETSVRTRLREKRLFPRGNSTMAIRTEGIDRRRCDVLYPRENCSSKSATRALFTHLGDAERDRSR